jgi:GTP pyrophosphokinase
MLIHANDRKGLLRDISSILTNEEVDVIAVRSFSDRKHDTATLRFTVEVANAERLLRLQAKIEQLPDVLNIKRQL